jgi:LmbE family N-acetylglucosaminyl deacetylase
MRILFLCPHPDDSEFFAGNTEVMAVKAGHEVVIACMTSDEYGTPRDDFKGKRIRRIRIREMEKAARIVGAKLDWLGFIDGYLPFNKSAFLKLKTYIDLTKPDIIFAPDPLFALDFHSDHVNTGKLIYLVLNRMAHPPLFLYYQSLKPNYFVPCLQRNQARKAFACHVSQGFSRRGIQRLQALFQLIFGVHTPNHCFAEGFRLIRFKPASSTFSPIQGILYWISRAVSKISMPGRDYYLPSPQELGLI